MKRKMILTPDMVSQSTTYLDPSLNGPQLAIDSDTGTGAHTTCQDGRYVWYKIRFVGERFVDKVVLINSFGNRQEIRMDGATVAVLNGDEENVCATLSVTPHDGVEKYSMNCNNLRGDGVILRGEEGRVEACIHIREIQVFETLYKGILVFLH